MGSAGGILGPCVQRSRTRNKPGLRQEEAGSAGSFLPAQGAPRAVPGLGAPPGLPRAGEAASSLSAKGPVHVVGVASAASRPGRGGPEQRQQSPLTSPAAGGLGTRGPPTVKRVLYCPGLQMTIRGSSERLSDSLETPEKLGRTPAPAALAARSQGF